LANYPQTDKLVTKPSVGPTLGRATIKHYVIIALKHPQNQRMFPKEPFAVNFARTEAYRRSAIPYCQRLLNDRLAGGSEDGGAGVKRRSGE